MRGELLLALAALSVQCHGAKLPSYFGKPCPGSAPEEVFSKCCEDAANRGIPFITKGDRKLKIPIMDPLVVPRVALAQGSSQINLNLTWNPLEIHGLPMGRLSNMRVSWEKKTTRFDVNFPRFSMAGPYTAAGRILLLPISGTGPSNFTFTNLRLNYTFDWPLEKARDGKEYATIANSKIEIVGADNLKSQMHGLFNGDRRLGEQMNAILNDNWREVLRELGPGMLDAAREVIEAAIKNLISHVPINDLMAP